MFPVWLEGMTFANCESLEKQLDESSIPYQMPLQPMRPENVVCSVMTCVYCIKYFYLETHHLFVFQGQSRSVSMPHFRDCREVQLIIPPAQKVGKLEIAGKHW